MPGPEANTVNVSKMCSAFAANGCDVTLAVVPGASPSALAEEIRNHYGLDTRIRVHPLPAIAARPSISALAGIDAARRARAALVYTRTPHVALAADLAGLASILEIHTDLDSFSPLARAATQRVARGRRVRGIVAISEALRARLSSQLPGATAPLVVAHDGADPLPDVQTPQRPTFTAGFVGRPYRGKGLELVLQLAALCPWARFEVVGATAQEAAELAGMRAGDNICFHGHVPHADVPRLISAWDVVLAPYQRRVIVADGRTDAARWMSPLKIFEYMAAGKPILASDLPVLREILTHEATALLLAPDAPELWADALAALRADPARGRALGARANEVFLAHHTWRARARMILQRCAPDLTSLTSAAPIA